MINTVNIKVAQLTRGFFTVGSGPTVMLIMGSCRVINYVNYFAEWNEANGNPFTIHSLDPFNFNWDINDDRVDYLGKLKEMETNDDMLKMLASVNIFIHEYYQNAGMFNVARDKGPSIYDFGMNPSEMIEPIFSVAKGRQAKMMDICIPSWNDLFVLYTDIITFDVPMRKMALQDYNTQGKLSKQTEEALYEISQKNLNKFYEVCEKSDLPEMADFFRQNFLSKRLWWTYNHTTKNFTLAVFDLINDKFLGLDLSKGFDRNHDDMFANNYTRLTSYDIDRYHYFWGEAIYQLKDKLF